MSVSAFVHRKALDTPNRKDQYSFFHPPYGLALCLYNVPFGCTFTFKKKNKIRDSSSSSVPDNIGNMI